jgi:hypothetical protein
MATIGRYEIIRFWRRGHMIRYLIGPGLLFGTTCIVGAPILEQSILPVSSDNIGATPNNLAPAIIGLSLEEVAIAVPEAVLVQEDLIPKGCTGNVMVTKNGKILVNFLQL